MREAIHNLAGGNKIAFLLALSLINYGLDNKLTPQNQITNALVYLGAAVVVVAVGVLVTGVSATQFVTINAVIMVALVAFNVYQSVSSPEHQSETQ